MFVFVQGKIWVTQRMTIENKMMMLQKKSSDFMFLFLFFDAAPTKKVKLFQELFLFSHLVFIIDMMIVVNVGVVVVVVVVEPWTSLRTYQCIRAFTQKERERERGRERALKAAGVIKRTT